MTLEEYVGSPVDLSFHLLEQSIKAEIAEAHGWRREALLKLRDPYLKLLEAYLDTTAVVKDNVVSLKEWRQ